MNYTIEDKNGTIKILKLLNNEIFNERLIHLIESRAHEEGFKTLLFKKDNKFVMIYLNHIDDVLKKSESLKKIFVICGDLGDGQSEFHGPCDVNGKIDLDLSFLKNIVSDKDFESIENGIKDYLKNLDDVYAEEMNALRSNPEKLYSYIENNKIDCNDVHCFFKNDKKAMSSLLIKELLESKKFEDVVSENLYNKQMSGIFKELGIKSLNQVDYDYLVSRFLNRLKDLNLISIVFPKILKFSNQLNPERLEKIIKEVNDERLQKEFMKYEQMKYKHFKRDIKLNF